MQSNNRKVLIVDSQDDERLALSKAFSEAGYAITLASDGLEGLNCLRKFVPDIIVSTMKMTRMSGFELCRIVRNTPGFENVLLMVITDKDDVTNRVEISRIGAADRLIIKSKAIGMEAVAHARALFRRQNSPLEMTEASDEPAVKEPEKEESDLEEPSEQPEAEESSPASGEDDNTLPPIDGLSPADMEIFERGKQHFMAGEHVKAHLIWRSLESTYSYNITLKTYLSAARNNIRKQAYLHLGGKEYEIRLSPDPSRYRDLTAEEGMAFSRLTDGMTIDSAIKTLSQDALLGLDILTRLAIKGFLRTLAPSKVQANSRR